MHFCSRQSDSGSEDEVEDETASLLSPVVAAAYEVLRHKHARYHRQLWNVTTGKVVGPAHQTPFGSWAATGDPPPAHDIWLPEKMSEIVARAESWVDVTSLAPPDGVFMDAMAQAVARVAQTANQEGHDTIILRFLFGNIIGMPVDCTRVLRRLTQDVPEGSNINLWVGSWRSGVSWNHAKIIAVDGKYLHTGGHNMWDFHYLRNNPVHDISMEVEGRVANDGHRFANGMWEFIERIQSSFIGKIVDRLPDDWNVAVVTRVTVTEYPEGETDEFPPMYDKSYGIKTQAIGHYPILSIGRYGCIVPKHRPSDDAICAMFDSAQTIIRLALQDLGPITLPGTKVAVPGCVWPKAYLTALGRAIMDRGVDVHIALSNPGSIPGGLKATEALYGNGWTCNDVASELIRAIQRDYEDVEDDVLRKLVDENLFLCYIRQGSGNKWEDGKTMGMHAKHFIIDDKCYYMGSQNLYIADLAEWGLVIDDERQTKQIMSEYWCPMWKYSFKNTDCDVDKVMDGLHIDRDGEDPRYISAETKALMNEMEDHSNVSLRSAAPHAFSGP